MPVRAVVFALAFAWITVGCGNGSRVDGGDGAGLDVIGGEGGVGDGSTDGPTDGSQTDGSADGTVSPCFGTRVSCATANVNCGPIADGCGGILHCGTCGAGESCGADPHMPGRCAVPPVVCVPLAACPAGINCGPYEDGCGGMISCGTCAGGQTCGGA
ncbi:MAG: hypothetical protein WCJ30_15620, partial [Deltaproteobacteria bacterium]